MIIGIVVMAIFVWVLKADVHIEISGKVYLGKLNKKYLITVRLKKVQHINPKILKT